MSQLNIINTKIYSKEGLKDQINKWKKTGNKIVFTNGCFDLLHRGHIEALALTADLGDKLIIALNSDESIKKIKGSNRPIMDQSSRSILLASLSFVDALVLFSEETPLDLITFLLPDILAKSGDYKISDIIGNKIVKKNGGRTVLIPFVEGFSSTNIIEKIKNI